ncbi:hypothetical protein COCOBI_12-4080 [Coccomyxa sp. Obi]|nr:hypothetical protein COCOBI_12-4080 [Coccomyxa sp. Obi]
MSQPGYLQSSETRLSDSSCAQELEQQQHPLRPLCQCAALLSPPHPLPLRSCSPCQSDPQECWACHS